MRKTYAEVKLVFNNAGYEIIGNYVNTKTLCECKCIKCNELATLNIRSIRKCKNCVHLEIIKLFKESNCVLMSNPSCTNSMEYICSCGNKSKIKLFNFKNGERCKLCSIAKTIKNNPKRLRVIKEIHSFFEKEGCKLLENKYENQHMHMKYLCSCGNESVITWKNFKLGHRCLNCAKNKIKNRFIPHGKFHFKWNPNRDEVKFNENIRSKIKSAFRRSLRLLNKLKTTKMFDVLEYSKNELTSHILNHTNWNLVKDTEWELDHYFPIKAFIDYKIYDEKKINTLENLQPLNKHTNRIKSDKYNKEEFEKWIKDKGWL